MQEEGSLIAIPLTFEERSGHLPQVIRMLQVSIFQTLQNNLATIDFSMLLIGVMTIADEVDSQSSRTMKTFVRSEGHTV